MKPSPFFIPMDLVILNQRERLLHLSFNPEAKLHLSTGFPLPWHFHCTYKPQPLDDFTPLIPQWKMELRQLLFYDNGMRRHLNIEILNTKHIRVFSRLLCSSNSSSPNDIFKANEITRPHFDEQGFMVKNTRDYLEYFTPHHLSPKQYTQLASWLTSRKVIMSTSSDEAQELVQPWKLATDKLVLEDWAEALNTETLNAISPKAPKYLRGVNKYGPLHKSYPLTKLSSYPMPLYPNYFGDSLIPDLQTSPPPFSLLSDNAWVPVGNELRIMAFVKDVEGNIHHLFLYYNCVDHRLYVDTITDQAWNHYHISDDCRLRLLLQLIENGYIKETNELDTFKSELSDYKVGRSTHKPYLEEFPSDLTSLLRPSEDKLDNLSIKRW